ncbi:MAG: hypothetical protein ACYDAO_03285 [Thermoplasmataceae archaeon]
MAKIGTIIAVVVVMVVVVTGSLMFSGIIKIPSLSSSPTTSSGTPSALNPNIQQKAPNVVNSATVNTSLGGSWEQKMGASGSASNFSSATPVMSFGLIGPSAKPYDAVLPAGIPGIENTHMSIYTPLTTSTQNYNPSNITITAFEANLYEPAGTGFAAVGYMQFVNSNNASQVYNYINASAHNSYNISTSATILNNGHNYLYQWAKQPFGYKNTMWNLSIVIGLDGTYLIGVFYFTPANLSENHFTKLLSSEITMLSNPASNPINSVFLTTSQVDSQTGISFNNTFKAVIGISNGLQMFNEIINAYNTPSSQSSSSAYRITMNDTLGNLTLVGLSEFLGGSYNVSVNEGNGYSYNMTQQITTTVGIANFSNTNAPSTVFTTITGFISQFQNDPQLSKTMTTHSGNINPSVGSGQYFYMGGPSNTSFYSNGKQVNTTIANDSVIFSYAGSFFSVIFYNGHSAMTWQIMLNLLNEEYVYL